MWSGVGRFDGALTHLPFLCGPCLSISHLMRVMSRLAYICGRHRMSTLGPSLVQIPRGYTLFRSSTLKIRYLVSRAASAGVIVSGNLPGLYLRGAWKHRSAHLQLLSKKFVASGLLNFGFSVFLLSSFVQHLRWFIDNQHLGRGTPLRLTLPPLNRTSSPPPDLLRNFTQSTTPKLFDPFGIIAKGRYIPSPSTFDIKINTKL